LGGLRTDEFGGRELMGDFCGPLATVDDLAGGTLAGVEVAFRTGGDLAFTVDVLEVFAGPAAGGDTTTSVVADSTGESGVASPAVGDLNCDADEVMIEGVGTTFGPSSATVDLGGHSLFCRISSLAESPVV
jgi:hypothetical protein